MLSDSITFDTMQLLERIQKELKEPRSFDSYLKLKQHEAQSLIDYIKALEEYNEFLAIDIHNNATFLSVHGINPSKETVEMGEKLRAKIASIKSKNI